MRRAFPLALLVAGLAACGGNDGEDGYPEEAIASFVSECRTQPGATEASCRCVIERLEVSMPYEEYALADEALRDDRAPSEASVEKLQTAAEACLGR